MMTHIFMTRFLASGEDNNARLIAGILQASGLAARYLNPEELGILVTDEPQNARILPASYTKNQCLGRNRRNFSDPRIFLGIRRMEKSVLSLEADQIFLVHW